MGQMEEYEVMKLLGKGSFGSVYCCRRTKDRSLHVMKKISIHNMPPKERAATEMECKVLQRLRHPGVVCYEDSFIHKSRQLCIVMAYCEGGDLSTLIEKRRMRYFPEADVISWFIQISLALQYMHEEKILHRDLKTQNIFLTKNNMIKLGDFGIAKVLEGTMEMAKTVIGTPYYMSPELFRNQPYSYKSDIWSLGCVLYELVSLRHAFDAREMKGLVQKILRGSYTPVPPNVSKDCRELVKGMLNLSPKSRPSCSEILSMPFIRKEMGAYIKSQLGDEAAANVIQNDPRALNFHQIEQARLEKQARKLGFDVQKREEPAEEKLPPPMRLERVDLKDPPKQSSLPSAADRERMQAEEREKERQKRAREFLERELRAKERAEEALKRLQKEKQERIKALEAQRELRAKRMQHVHPKGEAGNMNEWQLKLARAQEQHEERRKVQNARATPRGPTPRGQAEVGRDRQMSVLERRNLEARERVSEEDRANVQARDRNNMREEDKENIKQMAVVPAQNQAQQQQQQEANSAAQRLKAIEGFKAAENAKLREEMNRDMQQMELKLMELKKKKEEEAKKKAKATEDRRQREMLVEQNRKKEEDKKREEQQQRKDREAAAAIYKSKPSAPPAPARAASPPAHAPSRTPPMAPVEPPHLAPAAAAGGHMLPAANYPSHAPHPTAGRFMEPKPTNMASMAQNPRPPQERVPIRYVDSDRSSYQPVQKPTVHQEGGFSRFAKAPQMGKPPGLLQIDTEVRNSFPHPSNKASAIPTPNRLQAVPKADIFFGADDMLRDDGLSEDLIIRQKELDRQRARQSVQYERDRDIKEFDMNVHRINRAVGQAASSRPTMMLGEVGAKITERDRMLRQRQQRAQHIRMAGGNGEKSVRIFGDVAYEGGLYSPMKKKGAYFDDDIVEDDDMPDGGDDNMMDNAAHEVQDEELLYYDRECAKMEHEVAQRTLKIQMLKTAVMTPVISDDEDDDY